ncbi:MAG: oligosaccharide flippase family protein [Velocimicrobium sp.]
MSKQSLLKGTLILTFAGLLTRVMGFFYKIYLSNVMTSENLGLYQLIFPIYGIMYTLYGAGIQTAISQLIANKREQRRSILIKGCMLSFSIACSLSIFLYFNSNFIASHILMEKNCSGALRILSLLFPFCGITSCIQGYYFGMKKTAVPALSQLVEQIVRIAFVFFVATSLGNGDIKVSSELAVLGIVIGEIAANILCILSGANHLFPLSRQKEGTHIFHALLNLALPLTGTKLVISLLHSLEAIMIPFMLKIYGLSASAALSTYGILTGMTMPFLLFPTAITNAFALLILPTVSEAQSLDNTSKIKKTSELSVKYSILLGLYSTCVFFIFGNSFGTTFFHNTTAGVYMAILSWLCPFLYLSTTLSSILNGLGKAHITFLNTIISLSVRILFLCCLVPQKGLYGYLLGLLVSQLLIAILDYFSLKRFIPLSLNSFAWIIKPSAILFLCGFFFERIYTFLLEKNNIHQGILLLTLSAALGICYLLLLYVLRVITRNDLKASIH